MRHRETIRPYTVPDAARDSVFVACYAWDIQRQPVLLTGLRRDDGSLYLPKGDRFVSSSSIVISYLRENAS